MESSVIEVERDCGTQEHSGAKVMPSLSPFNNWNFSDFDVPDFSGRKVSLNMSRYSRFHLTCDYLCRTWSREEKYCMWRCDWKRILTIAWEKVRCHVKRNPVWKFQTRSLNLKIQKKIYIYITWKCVYKTFHHKMTHFQLCYVVLCCVTFCV